MPRRSAAGARTRITGGDYRGRLVDTPPGRAIRPTTALVREALFDILGPRVVGARIVDLYAGAGAIAFEALSRGAARVTAVERERSLVALMTATAARLGCTGRLRPVGADVLDWLRRRPREVVDADICYADAPYRDPGVEEVLGVLGEAPPALLVCEHHRARHLPELTGGLRLIRRSVYGATQLTFYTREPAGAGSTEADTRG